MRRCHRCAALRTIPSPIAGRTDKAARRKQQTSKISSPVRIISNHITFSSSPNSSRIKNTRWCRNVRRTIFIAGSSNKTDIMCNRSINCTLISSPVTITIITVTAASHAQADYRNIVLRCITNAPVYCIDNIIIASPSAGIRNLDCNNICALCNTINAPACSSNARNMRTMPMVIIRISIFSLIIRAAPAIAIVRYAAITILLNNPPAKVRVPIIDSSINHTRSSTAPCNIIAIHLFKPDIICIHNRHALSQKRMYHPHPLNRNDIRIHFKLLHLRPRNLCTDNINIIISMLYFSASLLYLICNILLGIHIFPENPKLPAHNLFIPKIDKHFDLLIIQKSPILDITPFNAKAAFITTISPCKTQNTQTHIHKNNRQENDFAHNIIISHNNK